MLGTGSGCPQALVPGVLPLTQAFPEAAGSKIPAQAHFCLKPSVFTRGSCAADTFSPCGLWLGGSLPLLSLPLAWEQRTHGTSKARLGGRLPCPMAVTKDRSNFY